MTRVSLFFFRVCSFKITSNLVTENVPPSLCFLCSFSESLIVLGKLQSVLLL